MQQKRKTPSIVCQSTYGVFGDEAAHFSLGDLDVVLNSPLDSASRARNPRSEGRGARLDWLAHLGVVDVCRLHHPEERVSSGPQPRINRLDQIFLSDDTNQRCIDRPNARKPRTAVTTWRMKCEPATLTIVEAAATGGSPVSLGIPGDRKSDSGGSTCTRCNNPNCRESWIGLVISHCQLLE